MIRFTGLAWDRNFQTRINENFQRAQKYVDSECLRLCDKYTPMLTGTMKRSGILGTVIGSGHLQYTAIYARRQYYGNAGNGRQGTARGGLRGKLWFERMKADHKDNILRETRNRFR